MVGVLLHCKQEEEEQQPPSEKEPKPKKGSPKFEHFEISQNNLYGRQPINQQKEEQQEPRSEKEAKPKKRRLKFEQYQRWRSKMRVRVNLKVLFI